ncbi:MAG: hypothetical protein WBX25_04260 [Rhodomicrobium sp.]
MRILKLFNGLCPARLIIVCVFSWTAAEAAEISILPTQNPEFRLIGIVGEFQPGDEEKFANVAIQAKSAIVILSSNGGAMYPAIEIGKAIRIKGFATYVGDEGICASACALTWLGGRKRAMSAKAQIGFHAVYTISDGLASVDGAGNSPPRAGKPLFPDRGKSG